MPRVAASGLNGDTPWERWAVGGARVRRLDAAALDEALLLAERRKVRTDRTVALRGRLYEVEAGLAGERVVLRFDPSAPPDQPIRVLHEGRPFGVARAVDPHANARIRRRADASSLSMRRLDPDDDDR